MAKQYQIRIRGKQRDDIDIDLLAQALLMLVEDLQAAQADTATEPSKPTVKPQEDAT